MAIRTYATLSKTGSTMTLSAAGAGPDTAPIENHGMLVVSNAHATLARTVTMVVPGTTEVGGSLPDLAVSVAALTTKFIPIINLYNDGSGACSWTYSDGGADLSVGLFKL
jgi:hypothetical protein